MESIILKQKEAKTVRFTVTDSNGDAVDLSSATLSFMARESTSDGLGATVSIEKSNSDFLRTPPYDDANGVVGLSLSTDNLDLEAARYHSELKVVFAADNIDKSANIALIIEESVHKD